MNRDFNAITYRCLSECVVPSEVYTKSSKIEGVLTQTEMKNERIIFLQNGMDDKIFILARFLLTETHQKSMFYLL